MNWQDMIDHARAERDAFKKRATDARKRWLQARKEKRWLDAIQIKDREQEYRRSAADRDRFIRENLCHVRATCKEKGEILS